MNIIIRKRQIIMSALVLALGSAVFVNWYFTKPQTEQVKGESQSYSVVGDAQYVNAGGETETAVQTDALTKVRSERNKAHDEAFDKLKAVIDDSSASQSAVDTAAKKLAELTENIKLEADIDALINAKCGFGSITTISESAAHIVCEKSSLDPNTILQIKEIVMKHTKINSENITIFEAK